MKKAVVMILLAPMLANATLTPNLLGRGTKTMTLSRNEICVIPNRLGGLKADGKPKSDYSEKDLQNEAKLCMMDASVNVAACAKENSTNPGVQFFEMPNGATIAQIESLECKENSKFPKIKKLAKYKNSTSCSYTPSILSYYHISRFLGGVNQVPAAVLRTLDVKKHIAIGETIDSTDGTFLTWPSLLKFLKTGKDMTNKDKMHGLFTDDFKQSYGALQKNPTGEEKYSELYNGGADQAIRAVNFKSKNPTYALLADSRSLSNMGFNQWSTANLQQVLRMQNVADMILLDTILSQEDRFGNLHYTVEAYAIGKDQNGQLNVKKQKELEVGQTYPTGTLQVKSLMMKDNDCGVATNRTNHLKNAGLLKDLKHFNPETYQKFLKLAYLVNSQEGQTFFTKETAMNPADYAKFKTNVIEAAKLLNANCKSGKLLLDLDLDEQFAGVKSQKSCDLILQ